MNGQSYGTVMRLKTLVESANDKAIKQIGYLLFP